MRRGEVRHCPKCGDVLRKVTDSERTFRGRVFFTLQCETCLHREQEWYEKPERPDRIYR